VLIDAGESGHGVFIGVDIDRLIHDLVKPADFIEPEGVIDMVMCEEDGIDAGDALAEDLFTEIRGGVYENDSVDAGGIGELDSCRCSRAYVAWVCGGARFAIACDNGDSRGGASA